MDTPPVVVIVPGLDGEGALFAPVVLRLNALGIRTEIVTHCIDEVWQRHDEAMAALVEEVNQVIRKQGPARVVLVGESFGSTVALQVARTQPALTGLILCGGFAYLPFPLRRKLLVGYPVMALAARFIPGVAVRFLAVLLRPLTRHSDPEWLRKAAVKMRVPTAVCLLAKIRLAMEFDARPWLAEIKIPTWIIAGGGDLTIPPLCVEILAQGLPHATVHSIPKAGHLAHHGNPDVVVDAIKQAFSMAGTITPE